MYFEILLLCSIGFWLRKVLSQKNVPSMRANQYAAIWTGIPLVFLVLYHRVFSVTELLCVCAAAGVIFCIRLSAGAWHRMRRLVCPGLKAIVISGIYGLAVNSYVPADQSSDIGKEMVMLIFLALSVLLIFSGKVNKLLKEWEGLFMILTFAAPVWGFYLIERVHNAALDQMDWLYITGNIFVLALLYVCLYVIFPHKKTAVGLFLTLCLAFGTANYYVMQFKGNPVMPSDLLSLNTAFQVAGRYEYQVTEQVATGVLNWYAAIVLLSCFPEKTASRGWKKQAAAGILSVVLCVNGLCTMDIEENYQLGNIDQWSVDSFYNEKGSVLGFAELVHKLSIAEPDGYSTQKAETLLAGCPPQEFLNHRNGNMEPAIIVVMDESFSDLRSLGEFSCTDEYLEEWYAADDFACRGNLYVSVYGGATANSEFEFLTGCSMANCASGAVPYQLYHLKNVGNLAGILSERGYAATAIHPQYKGNWNRMRVYENFGFEDFLGIEDFEQPRYIRSHISDESSFDRVTAVYEQNKGKQFIFNVTMQNHGGYLVDEMAGMDLIRLRKSPGKYEDVETYLTLIRESDRAVRKLLDYFRKVEEPVILCIFGDHHPNVSAEWTADTMGKPEEELSLEEAEQKYAVPYMIWANFETPYEHCEMDTSANYLGALLLENAGLQQSFYTSFLLRMREHIPVLNAFGYQTSDGSWHAQEEADAQGWLADYRMVQYYAMFDGARRQEYFR